MRFLSEEQTSTLITHEIAFSAVRAALRAAVTEAATVFPAVVAHGADRANVFTIKSASSPDATGVKIGSYWPGNDGRGLPRHGTTVLLIDPETGRLAAAVEASTVNAYRTAAADAVAADALARPDSRTLAVFGSGHQALYDCLALVRVRPIESVLVVARDPARGDALCRTLAAHHVAAERAGAREACQAADIVTTVTTSTAPLFDADWVRPGTHLASIGSDSRGKQELPPSLLERSRLFCDLPSQSLAIGEFQHIADQVTDGLLAITALGEVLDGSEPGRLSATDITVFDSSGIALQDLAVASALLARA